MEDYKARHYKKKPFE